MTGRRCVHTDTTHIIRMPARHTATTVRSGLTAEYLSAPVRGITGVGEVTDTGVAVGIGATVGIGVVVGIGATARIGVAAATDAVTPEGMRGVVTDAAMPVATAEEGTHTATRAVDSMAADTMVEATSTVVAGVGSTVVVAGSTVVVADSTAEAEASTVADTGNPRVR